MLELTPSIAITLANFLMSSEKGGIEISPFKSQYTSHHLRPKNIKSRMGNYHHSLLMTITGYQAIYSE